MSEHDEIRSMVSESYARAVRGAGGCCSGVVVPAGVAAKLAGYRPEEVEGLPGEAVAASFGCGNPVAFAEVRPGDVVLDLGSGAGIDLLLAARKVGPGGRVVGIDMTDEMIARARRAAADAGFGNVEVRKGLIEELPVESASVDWVISNCVINLSPEKERVFAEIARVLRPGGRLSVSDIVVSELPAWARSTAALYASCVAGAISEEEYVAGLQRAGLTDVEVADRLVYDPEQLAALVASDLDDPSSCCGGVPAAEALRIARALAGKAWSARFHARKPG